MKPGAVIVDVAVDQGGCAETTHPTTHDDPVYIIDGVVHYCVANMPGVVALSSTQALTSATLYYGLKIAESGIEEACKRLTDIRYGVNTFKGNIVYSNVAKAFDIPYVNLDSLL
jgi:alanine dehydrogenase